MSIENRIILISGATGVLGSLLAHRLASQNAKLAFIDRDPAKLDRLVKDLSLPEARVTTEIADLLDAAQTQAAAEAVVKKFGRVEAVFHLVGGWTGGKSLVEAPASDVQFMLNQHLWSSFNLIQAFVPHLVKNGWGRVVMVSSPFAANPAAKGGPYAIGKAAQEALMQTLAQELKGSGVTANLLLVKTIDTGRKKVAEPGSENAAWTTPEEIVAAMQYLLSEEAGTVNGAKLPLFGGYH